jgi:hypothetical protein
MFVSYRRTVTYDQGVALANQLGVPFIECSSKTGEYVGACVQVISEHQFSYTSNIPILNESLRTIAFLLVDCVILITGEAFSALLAEVEKENPTEVAGRSESSCQVS